MQHALPDGGSRGAGVNEHHDVRAGIVIEGVPRRSGGDVGGNGIRLNPRLLVGKGDSLGGNIHSLHEKPDVSIVNRTYPPHFYIHLLVDREADSHKE